MKRYILYIIVMMFASIQASAQTSVNYTYDNLNRLTEVKYDNGVTVAYSYDALGNRTKKTITGSQGPKEAYAWLSSDGKTLTFCYDSEREDRNGTTYDLSVGYGFPDWNSNPWDAPPCQATTTVVFNPSFEQARPENNYGWFQSFSNLTQIIGLQYLNTSNVRTMSGMFSGCSKLTELDLSHFDTSNVLDMVGMFSGCSLLTSLDLSSFNTSKVTDMTLMFSSCTSLKNLDLSHFNTSNVVRFLDMFYNCQSLTSLDVSSFDTNNAIGSSTMLKNCQSLKSLRISSSMDNLSDDACVGVGRTTAPCSIFAPDGFDYGVDTSGDYFVWKSGYFKMGNKKEAYAWLSNDSTTLTFCYDSIRYERDGTTYDLRMVEDQEYWLPGWQEDFVETDCSVSTVVINPSFADARPIYTCYWFRDMTHLKAITGLEYLNTSEVKSMYDMFSGCTSLTALDLSHFETSKVKNMSEMFYGCSALKRLDLSHFKTDSLERINFLCDGCTNLESIVFGNYNTSKLKECHYMFFNCRSLKRIDLSGFDFSRVTSSTWMLGECVGLESLVIPYSMDVINGNACSGIGSRWQPCAITAPAGFDFGVDTSGDYFVWKSGYFKLGSGMRGDVDGNDKVNIDDLTALIGYLLNGDATGLDLANADCYPDGRISIDDVTTLINYMLSGNW